MKTRSWKMMVVLVVVGLTWAGYPGGAAAATMQIASTTP